jgi:uncharacterized protein (TIGR03085 family)
VTTAARPSNALARSERSALCDLLVEVGPDAPTLCAGWTARDLAAHLVIRENRPDAAIGIIASPLAGWTGRVQDQAARRPWATLVDDVRNGPPRWAPQSIATVDAAMNTIEFFVHHEDVRRGSAGWEPRVLSADDATDLWGRFAQAGKLLMRRSPVGVVAEPTDGPAAGTSVTLRGGDRVVTLAGPVGEIVLAGFGRATRGLDIRGADADVVAFLSFPR